MKLALAQIFFWKFITVSYFIRNAASCCVFNINNKQPFLEKGFISIKKARYYIQFSANKIRELDNNPFRSSLLYKVLSLIHFCYPWDLLKKSFCILVITVRATFTQIFITKAVLNYHGTRIKFKPHSSSLCNFLSLYQIFLWRSSSSRV